VLSHDGRVLSKHDLVWALREEVEGVTERAEAAE
jgi:hypothetical protein